MTKSPVPTSLGLHTKNLSVAVSLARMSFSTNAAGLCPVDANFGQAHDGLPAGLIRFPQGAGNNGGKAVRFQPAGKLIGVGDRLNGASADLVDLRVMNR